MGCFVYALLGSTHAITIGPTALMALVTYDSGATQMGPEAAILLAFITGCIILLFGLLNFGDSLVMSDTPAKFEMRFVFVCVCGYFNVIDRFLNRFYCGSGRGRLHERGSLYDRHDPD